jgi:hypothetical protein
MAQAADDQFAILVYLLIIIKSILLPLKFNFIDNSHMPSVKVIPIGQRVSMVNQIRKK